MARRKNQDSGLFDALFDAFTIAPRWVGPVLAAFTFAFLKWMLPLLLGVSSSDNKMSQGVNATFSQIAVTAAPFFAGLILCIWVIAELMKRFNARRLDSQTGAASIAALGWREFEQLLGEAFKRQGFLVQHCGNAGPDGGIDLRLEKAGAITLVQCKHWKVMSVGVGVVRELLGVVTSERAQSGIVVTSGGFTPDAREFAATNPIRLIDGEELVAMIAQVGTPGRDLAVESSLPPAQPAQASKTATAAACATDPCPKCGAPMEKRLAKRGASAGKEFWGCSRYPECRGTRN